MLESIESLISKDGLRALLEPLTPEQRSAVTHPEGPLLIVAGAGTGKTKVLTSRVVWLILSGRATPEEILALTFTDKAAGEMQERLDIALPLGLNQVEIGTFHSVCDRLLRRYALEMGFDTEFNVLSQAEALLLLRENLFELPLDLYRPHHDPLSYLRALVTHFGKAKDEVVRPDDYLAWIDQLESDLKLQENSDPAAWDRLARQRELALCYRRYQEILSQRGYLDFGDQLIKFLELLDTCPHVLGRLQQRFKYILVDEFQDTNRAQFEMLQKLAGEHGNITVVGDDDQAIYGFRGAALSNILDFTRVFSTATQVVLTSNFRSIQPILDAAYHGIRHNDPERLEVQNGLDKKLRAASPALKPLAEEPIELKLFQTLTEEADAVAERVEQLVSEAGLEFSDCAILVRINRDARPYLQALSLRDIPYRFTGSQGLYETEEVRLLLSFCRALSDPYDSVATFHLASSMLFNLPRLRLISLNAYARRENLTLRQALQEHRVGIPGEGVSMGEEERESLERFLGFLDSFADRLMEETPGQLMRGFLEESGWLNLLSHQESLEAVTQAQNLARFFDRVKSHETLFPDHKLPHFIEHLDMLRESGDSPAVVEADFEVSAVSVMTVHSSKGLEFPAVFLVGLTNQRFPAWQRRDPLEFPAELKRSRGGRPLTPEVETAEHTAEERRLFYVAMTRAKQHLWLSMAYDEGRRRSAQVSPFIREVFKERALDLRPQRTSAVEQLSQLNSSSPGPTHQQWGTMSADVPLRLSFRKLNLYWTCPQQYLYSEVMQLAVTAPHSVAFGQALHEAVKFTLQLKQQGNSPTLEEVQGKFRSRLRRQGYLSAQHLEADLERGLGALETFMEQEKGKAPPEYVERDFRFRLENNWIIGRWDRVDKTENGWVITDYKSSEVRSQEEADQRAQESRQLQLYALALQEMVGELPELVCLNFLGSGLIGRATGSGRQLFELKRDIRTAAHGIRQRNYEAKPSLRRCGACPYQSYCPATLKS